MAEVKRALEGHQQDLVTASTLFWGDWHSGIADRVWEERVRQITRWGLQRRPNGTSAETWKLRELAAKDEYEAALEAGECTWVHILTEEVYEAFAEEDIEKLKVELVQVMAVAASWLQHLELGDG